MVYHKHTGGPVGLPEPTSWSGLGGLLGRMSSIRCRLPHLPALLDGGVVEEVEEDGGSLGLGTATKSRWGGPIYTSLVSLRVVSVFG